MNTHFNTNRPQKTLFLLRTSSSPAGRALPQSRAPSRQLAGPDPSGAGPCSAAALAQPDPLPQHGQTGPRLSWNAAAIAEFHQEPPGRGSGSHRPAASCLCALAWLLRSCLSPSAGVEESSTVNSSAAARAAQWGPGRAPLKLNAANARRKQPCR